MHDPQITGHEVPGDLSEEAPPDLGEAAVVK